MFADGSTLAEAAARVARAPDSARESRAAADEIVRLTPDVEQASSRLTHFRAALKAAGAPRAAIEAAKRPALTTAANQRRFARFGEAGGRAQTGLSPPPHWGFEAVRARLARIPMGASAPARPAEKSDVLDVMVALAARPSEVKTLAIGADGLVRGFSKSRGAQARPYAGMLERSRAALLLAWVQTAIARGRLPDPGTPGSKPYRELLGPHGLKPKDLRVLGAEYAARAALAPTDAMRLEVRRLALRHSAARTPAQYYSIVRDAKGAPAEAPPAARGPKTRKPRQASARVPERVEGARTPEPVPRDATGSNRTKRRSSTVPRRGRDSGARSTRRARSARPPEQRPKSTRRGAARP